MENVCSNNALDYKILLCILQMLTVLFLDRHLCCDQLIELSHGTRLGQNLMKWSRKIMLTVSIVLLPLVAYFPLLFISYQFVKGFLAIILLLLVFFEKKHSWCVSTFFLYNREQTFSWIRQKMRNFPIDPHCKNRPLL